MQLSPNIPPTRSSRLLKEEQRQDVKALQKALLYQTAETSTSSLREFQRNIHCQKRTVVQ
jgi:hypothetical protein